MENIQKKVCETAFLAVLNFFLVQKLIFGHFWNSKKWNLAQKFFSWNWFIWLHEFFRPGLFKIFWHTVHFHGKKVHPQFPIIIFAGPPHVRQTSPVKAIEGHTLQIACPASGYPIEGILWKKGRQSKKLNKLCAC